MFSDCGTHKASIDLKGIVESMKLFNINFTKLRNFQFVDEIIFVCELMLQVNFPFVDFPII